MQSESTHEARVKPAGIILKSECALSVAVAYQQCSCHTTCTGQAIPLGYTHPRSRTCAHLLSNSVDPSPINEVLKNASAYVPPPPPGGLLPASVEHIQPTSKSENRSLDSV